MCVGESVKLIDDERYEGGYVCGVGPLFLSEKTYHKNEVEYAVDKKVPGDEKLGMYREIWKQFLCLICEKVGRVFPEFMRGEDECKVGDGTGEEKEEARKCIE